MGNKTQPGHQDRHWHLLASLVLAAGWMGTAAMSSHSFWSLLAISLAAIGCFSVILALFAIAPRVLTPAETGGNVVIITSLGRLGSLVGSEKRN